MIAGLTLLTSLIGTWSWETDTATTGAGFQTEG